MRQDAGVSLIELLVAVALLSFVVTVGLVYSMRWMASETLRTAAQDIRAQLRLAQIESISRNRPCRFVLDPAQRRMVVWDTAGTSSLGDDVALHDAVLPRSVAFTRPDTGAAIGLQSLGGNRFQAVFDSEGIVVAGDGQIHLGGASSFGRISVFVAGGIEISYWTGTEWEVGV